MPQRVFPNLGVRAAAGLFLLLSITISSSNRHHHSGIVEAFAGWGAGVPTLASGHSWADTDGTLHYVTYAEEGAPVDPPMAWELRDQFGVPLKTQDVLVYAAKAGVEANRYKNNSLFTISETRTFSKTQVNQTTITPARMRYSSLSWWVTDLPLGATGVQGTTKVMANADYQFVIPDITFPLSGQYNVHYNMSLYYGANVLWNKTVTVNKQPQTLALMTSPVGYNGSALSPAPKVEFRDYFEAVIRTSTPVTTLTLLAGPENATFGLSALTQPTVDGVAIFANVVPSLPGTYVFRLDATLSDSQTLSTSAFTVEIQKALPVEIVNVQQPLAIARFVFTQHPRYQLRDSSGFVQDTRTDLNLSLFLNEPSVGYEGLSTLAILNGTVSAQPENYYYSYTDLSIDLPGRYEIEATLYLNGEIFMNHILGFNVGDPPTWEVPEGLTVNTVGIITIYGLRPPHPDLQLRMSKDINCISHASNAIYWPFEDNAYRTDRNISFTPFTNGDVYLCLQIPAAQESYVPLLKHYLPSFNELFPLFYTFLITDVAECKKLTGLAAKHYNIAGWTTARENRMYGCLLSPPVNGTVAPCDCPLVYACEAFNHHTFDPPTLDIGRCVCCKPWVMAVSGTSTCLFMAAVLFVIFQWA